MPGILDKVRGLIFGPSQDNLQVHYFWDILLTFIYLFTHSIKLFIPDCPYLYAWSHIYTSVYLTIYVSIFFIDLSIPEYP